MADTQPPSRPCHNCRRRRLKCDQALPNCRKCLSNGQECLGYQRLFRWQPGIASRGKMAGLNFDEIAQARAQQGSTMFQMNSTIHHQSRQQLLGNVEATTPRILMDPLLQDLSYNSRKYLSYFASDVCKDLVLYDLPHHNQFRELIPLAHQHPVLLHIIIASSALRMSNAAQKFIFLDPATLHAHNRTGLLSFPGSDASGGQQSESYNHALAAKQRALHLLQGALASKDSIDIDVTLAVVLLFIEFELIDSGRNNWTHHINGARSIIHALCGSERSVQTPMNPLRSCLISNCLVFDIIGSSLARSILGDPDSTDDLTLLQDAEGNHCSSFPTVLLQLLRAGAQVSALDESISQPSSSISFKQQQIAQLLFRAQSFDPPAWAISVQQQSPTADLELRTHIAFAHRAAVCIYLSRTLLTLDPAEPSHDLEPLVGEVISHLSFIRPESPLFTATTWPAFIAGAETINQSRQGWVARRFQEMWVVEPWGVIRGALGLLEKMWIERNREVFVEDEGSSTIQRIGVDWIGHLRRNGVDWLIL